MLKLISLLFTALFLVAGVTLGVLNPQPIQIDLFWWQFNVALSVVMAIVFIIGMLIGASIMLVQVTRLKWQIVRQKRQVQKQANEVVELKKQRVSSLTTLEDNRNLLIKKENTE